MVGTTNLIFKQKGHKRKASKEAKGDKLVNRYLKNGATMRAIKDGDLSNLNENDVSDLKFYFGTDNSVAHLESLDLSNRNLNLVMSKVLAKITTSPTLGLKVLSLNNISIDPISLNYIINSIGASRSLKKFFLSRCKINKSSIQQLFDSINNNNDSCLEVLAIERMILDAGSCKAFLNYLPKNSEFRLKALSFSECSIESEGFSYIASALRNNRFIEELNLSYNLIGANGSDHLYHSLIFNHTLINLNLEGNNFGSRGCARLAACLEINSSIKYLNLNNNSIDDGGIIPLYSALKINKTIQRLELSQNRLGDDSCLQLNYVLKKNNSLISLNLSSNIIGPRGGVILSEALKVNRSIEEINLNNNNLSDLGLSAIIGVLIVNPLIQSIDLCKNSVQDNTIYLSLLSRINKNINIKSLNIDYDFTGWEVVYSDMQNILTRNFIFYKERVDAALNVLFGARMFCCSKNKTGFSKEILEYIAIGFDKKSVLTQKQYIRILDFASNRETLGLGLSKLEYLRMIFDGSFRFYPITNYKSHLNRNLE